MRGFVSFVVLALLAGCVRQGTASPPQDIDRAALDARATQLMHEAHVTGLGLAVIRDGRVVYLKGYGMRDVAKQLPMQPDTVIYGASLTKAAFAYSVMALVDQGKLAPDASIAGMLPKPLPSYGKYADLAGDERWRKLTPRILLNHTTGFANFRYLQPGKDYDPNGKLMFYFESGTRFAYSGEGINLMQFVLEEGKGVDVATLMHDRLFVPFDMPRTSMTWRDDFSGNVAIGYDENGKALGHKQRSGVRAAGSMDTTLHDYANLAAAMVRGEGLSPAAYKAWLAPSIRIHSLQQFPTMGMPDTTDNDGIGLGYAWGIGRFESPGGPAFFKEGHDDGANNLMLCLVRSRSCVLLLSNSSNGESIFPAMVEAVLGKTCFPFYWNSYIPYDHPEWRKQPFAPCTRLP
jgi:CubicO group peptidase (beta-lactamase class C family)